MATDIEIREELSRIKELLRHKTNVLDACLLLGERLIEVGEIDLGRQLMANGYCHDISKFRGIEFKFLNGYAGDDKDGLRYAIDHHNQTNDHHPESWGGIKKMPRIFLAEMICDWHARASEFGTSLIDWINDEALKRFEFTKQDKVYKEIKFFVKLLINQPFSDLEKT